MYQNLFGSNQEQLGKFPVGFLCYKKCLVSTKKSYMLKGGGERRRGVHKCGICISNFEHAFVCKEKTVASRVSMQQETLGDLFNLER